MSDSKVYSWGKGTWSQLGQGTRVNTLPDVATDWNNVLQVMN